MICCGELTIISIFLVLGDTLRICLECIDGSPSAAKSNNGAPNSISVDISPFSGFVDKPRCRAFADPTNKTLRRNHVLVNRNQSTPHPSLSETHSIPKPVGPVVREEVYIVSKEKEFDAAEDVLLALDT